MINVHPTIYRLLWIAVAVLGALLAIAPIMLLSDGVEVNDGAPMIVGSGVLGAIALAYSIRRLVWPLKPKK